MSFEAALQTFYAESRELLEQMEDLLLHIETMGAVSDPETLNAIFRTAHTIKGSAGIFDLKDIVQFTHVVENVLDKVRAGTITITPDLATLLLECGDHIGHLLDATESPTHDEEATQLAMETGERLVTRLMKHLEANGHAPQKTAQNPTKTTASYTLTAIPDQPTADANPQLERLATQVSSDNWHISVRFGENSFHEGMDPLAFLRFLTTLGDIIHIVPVLRTPTDPALYDPEACYLGFEIQFDSIASKQEIEDVFEFMRHDGFLRILPPHCALEEYKALIQALPEVDLRLGEILQESGALTKAELETALNLQAANKSTPIKPIGEFIVEQDPRLTPVLEAALHKQQAAREHTARESRTLRVDADKLDRLINRVGELVTSAAGSLMLAETTGNAALVESVTALNDLLEEVREAALKLRMVPIGATFSKFQRVVRDTAKELGKDVELSINGADTELDKSVVEKIGDPLMHLVRNALDHGIELPDVRERKGKTARATLQLNAYHDSGNIVIEVADDGRGIDPEFLRKKAIEKGLLDESAQLSREEALDLIFYPGFSTSAAVSNISGRGVGMDVVKRNITDLRGQIRILSEIEVGTTIQIMLPLTLAIIDGFLIGVSGDAFVIPLEMVQECVELKENDQITEQREHYINLRGEVLPLINLHQHFNLDGPVSRRQSVVVVRTGNQRCGLVVDRLMGEFQTVIKPLGSLFDHLKGIGGSTIMGDGRVALILDVPGLVQRVISTPLRSMQTNSRAVTPSTNLRYSTTD